MASRLPLAKSELILGGQKSGKSRRAEALAQSWLAAGPNHCAVLIATAQAGDDEMRQRIARHQLERAERLPGITTVEEPLHLAQAIALQSRPNTLVVIDCLTLWLTNWMMPLDSREFIRNMTLAHIKNAPVDTLLEAISAASGPLVLVGNEIGLGVIPMGAEVRAFVDALGTLNQQVAARCTRVTLMAAGLPLNLKDPICA
jgi:adenosylcobinamide kinase/adenosylcobinamide-phosphate guanylyltransferase